MEKQTRKSRTYYCRAAFCLLSCPGIETKMWQKSSYDFIFRAVLGNTTRTNRRHICTERSPAALLALFQQLPTRNMIPIMGAQITVTLVGNIAFIGMLCPMLNNFIFLADYTKVFPYLGYVHFILLGILEPPLTQFISILKSTVMVIINQEGH